MKFIKVFLIGLLTCIAIVGSFILIIQISTYIRKYYTFSPLVPLLAFLAIMVLPIIILNIAFKILAPQNRKKVLGEEVKKEKDQNSKDNKKD